VYETGSAITASGALSAYSGAKTGRSPSDKRIVQEAGSENNVWWGPVNKPMTEDVSCLSSAAAPPVPSHGTVMGWAPGLFRRVGLDQHHHAS
jgi:hypothetical protein